jgi:hypothetical protein
MLNVAASLLPELLKAFKDVLEDPETYKKIEGLRQILEKLTGKEIDQNDLVGLLEGVTQGAPFTGEWEEPTSDDATVRRVRVDGGWIYDIGRGNGILVAD